ncbi:MAG TPA: ATP-binding protein, partial [Clostridiaceae bacterium]|nr:ATP-binding protein [Clostridiaceae bacterium]
RGITEHPLTEELARQIRTVLDMRLISLIEQNADIVLDYSFWSVEMRMEYLKLLRGFGIEPEIHYMKVPKEIAMERIRKRSGNHKDEIRLTEEMASLYYDHFQPPTADEGEIIEIKGDLL